jgi:isoquinoline 1-oxidoreductase beta subunit
MLVAAAAKRWGVAEAGITVRDGLLSAGKHRASFGELAEAAAQEAVPTDVKLKDPAQFRLIGKRAPRTDAREKSNGTARFTQDVKLPGLLTAVVAHPPRFGARVAHFDASQAKSVAGVTDVVQVPNGIAVLAKDFWSAKKRPRCPADRMGRKRRLPQEQHRPHGRVPRTCSDTGAARRTAGRCRQRTARRGAAHRSRV